MKKSLLSTLPSLLFFAGFVSAQTPAPSPAGSSTPAPTTVQKVYLPYDKLEQIFDNEGQGVFLPYREFIDMWNKVNMAEVVEKSEPPVSGILASANYAGKVSGDIIGSQRIEIRPSAKVIGNLTAPILVVHEGALFEGHCSMQPEGTQNAKVTVFAKDERVAVAGAQKQA